MYTPNKQTEGNGVTTGTGTTDEPLKTHTRQTTVYTKDTTNTVDAGKVVHVRSCLKG